MNLLILDQFTEPGGAQLCLRDLASEIVRRGWQATFAAPGNGGIREALAAFGIRNHFIDGFDYSNGRKTPGDMVRYGLDMARMLLASRGMVRANRPDLVYINGPRLLPAAVAFRCPIVFHAHSRLNKTYTRWIAAASLRTKGVQTIAASRYAGEALERPGRGHGVRVIYSGVPDLGFATRLRRGQVRIGIIGRIAPEKGQLYFVRAARLLCVRGIKAEFVVYGAAMFTQAGYEQRIRREAAGLPVRFAGWTEDVATALHELDILAVPSSAIEAAGRVVMEAMSAGTPVVAYPAGGIPELISDGRTGVLTKDAAEASLAESIEDLLGDPDRASQMARAGRQEWESRFRVERFQREVCDHLERISQSAYGPS